MQIMQVKVSLIKQLIEGECSTIENLDAIYKVIATHLSQSISDEWNLASISSNSYCRDIASQETLKPTG